MMLSFLNITMLFRKKLIYDKHKQNMATVNLTIKATLRTC